MVKIITDEDIEKIVTFSFRNSTLKIKKLLMDLVDLPKDSLRDDIRGLIRNNGRSTMISVSELENVLMKGS